MQILLCAATEFEIQPMKEWLKKHKNYSVNTLITGIGLVSATYHLTKAVSKNKPEMLIMGGIAGAFDPSIKMGEVRAIRQEMLGDMGVEELGKFNSLFAMKLMDLDHFPFSQGRLTANQEILDKSRLLTADGISVNEISTSVKRREYYSNELGAAIESMEGAALHFIGLMEDIPFLQLRAISNTVGERDKNNWNMKEAIMNLNRELINQVKIFSNEI
jgi:futalosine hydrolase